MIAPARFKKPQLMNIPGKCKRLLINKHLDRYIDNIPDTYEENDMAHSDNMSFQLELLIKQQTAMGKEKQWDRYAETAFDVIVSYMFHTLLRQRKLKTHDKK